MDVALVFSAFLFISFGILFFDGVKRSRKIKQDEQKRQSALASQFKKSKDG